MASRSAPAGGTGSTNDARPGANVSGAAQSSVTANGPGPGSTAACTLPSMASGSGRPSALASVSVAPAIRLTRVIPRLSTSPARLKTPCAVSRSMRTRRSALATTAGMGGIGGGCGGRPARSIRRLYSASESVTLDRVVSVGRAGCASAAVASRHSAAVNSVDDDGLMSHLAWDASVVDPPHQQIDGGRARFRRQLRGEEHGRSEPGELDVNRQRAGHALPAAFVPEAIGERLQPARTLAAARHGDAQRGARHAQRFGERTRIAIDAKRAGDRLDTKPRRVVQLDAGTRNRQVERRQLEVRPALVGPWLDALHVDELDDERRRRLSGAPFLE